MLLKAVDCETFTTCWLQTGEGLAFNDDELGFIDNEINYHQSYVLGTMVNNGTELSGAENESTNSSYHAVHMQYLYYFADSVADRSKSL